MMRLLVICIVMTSTSPTLAQRDNWPAWRHKLDSGERSAVEEARTGFAGMYRRASARKNKSSIIFSKLYLSLCDFQLGKRNRAKEDLERLIAQNTGDPLMVLVHGELGTIYQIEWQTKKADAHLTKALLLAKSAPKLDASRFQLSKAINHVILGENDVALEEFTSMLNSVRGMQTREALYIRTVCEGQLAELDYRDASMSNAIGRLKKSVADLEKIEDPKADLIERAVFWHMALAKNYRELTRFEDAEDELEATEALLVKKHKSGKNNGNRILGSLRIERHQEELENARAGLQLEWARAEFDIHGPTKKVLERLDAAAQAAKRAKQWHSAITDDATKETAVTLSVLAAADRLRGRFFQARSEPDNTQKSYAQAMKSYNAAIDLFVKLLEDPKHDVVVELRRDRVSIGQQLGNGQPALFEARLLLNIYQTRYGKDTLQTASIHQLLISLEAQAGNLREAIVHTDTHRRITNKHSLTTLAGLTPAAQQSFSRRWNEPGLHLGLKLAATNLDDNDLVGRSVEWLMNGKAKSAEVLAHASQQARRLENADAFRKKVEHQAYLIYGPKKKDQTARLLSLESEKRQLIASRNLDKNQVLFLQKWFQLGELRRALHPDEVFVDIFSVIDEHKMERVYYAWIVTAAKSDLQPVRIVRLGNRNADEIDRHVAELIAKLGNKTGSPKFRAKRGAAEAERELRHKFLKPLQKLVFRPLWDAIGKQRRWIISPDGELWNLPWAAMIVPDSEKYAVEEVTFRYVISARDLFGRHAERVNLEPPRVIAKPSLNWHPPNANGEMRSQPFPELEVEGEDVFKLLREKDSNAQLFVKEKANKESLMQIKAPRILYLSTHGGFLERGLRRVDDPFLCCYVALAGYNFLPASRPNVDDSPRLPGVLTGAEVLLTDLRGTELVVLSACQTGRGISSYGHSAASLRHAFHLAGARAVVSTHWSVSNEPTNALMMRYMENLVTHNMDKAKALQRAQIWMIEGLQNGDFELEDSTAEDHSHPYLWAAFLVSGF